VPGSGIARSEARQVPRMSAVQGSQEPARSEVGVKKLAEKGNLAGGFKDRKAFPKMLQVVLRGNGGENFSDESHLEFNVSKSALNVSKSALSVSKSTLNDPNFVFNPLYAMANIGQIFSHIDQILAHIGHAFTKNAKLAAKIFEDYLPLTFRHVVRSFFDGFRHTRKISKSAQNVKSFLSKFYIHNNQLTKNSSSRAEARLLGDRHSSELGTLHPARGRSAAA